MRVRVLAAVLLAGSACTAPAVPPADMVVENEGPEVRVTRDSGEGPRGCRPGRVGRLFSDFLVGYGEGDEDVAGLFAADMEWFSLSEWSPEVGKRHFVTHDRDGLARYLEKRPAANDRMTLLEVQVQYDPGRNIGHLVYSIHRTADGFDADQPIVIGKGAVDCARERIRLLSMSHDTRHQRPSELCPGEAKPPERALACSSAGRA